MDASPPSPPHSSPSSGSAEFTVTVDATRNLVRTHFAGRFDAASMLAAADQVAKTLPGLSRGFSVLADFSRLASIDFESVPHLTRIMDLCREHGIGFIVRVLPTRKHDIGINLLAVVHYRGKVKTVTVDNLADAERALH